MTVLNPGGGTVLVVDTDVLAGDELIDLGDGRMVRVADVLGDADTIEIMEGDGR